MSTTHVVCPHCDTVNRLPTDRLGDGPKCGKCRQQVFAGKAVALTGANFDRAITRNDIPVLVDFWAPWCGPCKMMAPAYEQAAVQLEPAVRLAKINTEAEQMLGGRFNIRSIPTMVLFQNGRELVRQSGAMGAADIVRWVNNQL